jgi:heme O synthase-like polyprenyltransferase
MTRHTPDRATIERLIDEAHYRDASAREVLRDYIDAVNDGHLSRGHVRPEAVNEGAVAAYIVIIAAATVGGLSVWLLPPVFNAFFAWLVGWL